MRLKGGDDGVVAQSADGSRKEVVGGRANVESRQGKETSMIRASCCDEALSDCVGVDEDRVGKVVWSSKLEGGRQVLFQ